MREGHEVDLKKWPTKVDPTYKSKEQYKKLLEEHVEQLSSQQQLHYASNRHAILLIFQAMDAAGKRRRHQARDVRGQPPRMPGVQLQASQRYRIGTRFSVAHQPRSAGTRADRHLQPILLRGGTDRPRASRDPPKRSDSGHAASRQESLARPVSFDRGFGEAPLRQRNPHHQVLPPPLEGGAAKALSGAHRRAGKELEIQYLRTSPRGNSGSST